MILVDLLEYLNENLSVEVYAEAPEALTNYVLLDQTGSTRSNHIVTTTIAIQSYAPSLIEAMQLNDQVTAQMEGFAELAQVTRCELTTDYNFTNTASKQYRWQAVWDITHY
ncbi:MAG: hypothetical protein IIZ78_12740 [Clostridiales bacterium]|nr:hypothetical protein [Clostridiales bacterium]